MAKTKLRLKTLADKTRFIEHINTYFKGNSEGRSWDDWLECQTYLRGVYNVSLMVTQWRKKYHDEKRAIKKLSQVAAKQPELIPKAASNYCNMCAWWQMNETCHRYPTSIPKNPNDWCGEFKGRK